MKPLHDLLLWLTIKHTALCHMPLRASAESIEKLGLITFIKNRTTPKVMTLKRESWRNNGKLEKQNCTRHHITAVKCHTKALCRYNEGSKRKPKERLRECGVKLIISLKLLCRDVALFPFWDSRYTLQQSSGAKCKPDLLTVTPGLCVQETKVKGETLKGLA